MTTTEKKICQVRCQLRARRQPGGGGGPSKTPWCPRSQTTGRALTALHQTWCELTPSESQACRQSALVSTLKPCARRRAAARRGGFQRTTQISRFGEFRRGMAGSAGTCQPAAAVRRSQARRRARPAYDRRRGACTCGHGPAPPTAPRPRAYAGGGPWRRKSEFGRRPRMTAPTTARGRTLSHPASGGARPA